MKNKAEIGDKVSVHYTGTLENGQVFDSTKGKPPLSFTLGQGQLLEKFEGCVLGMGIGEKRKVSLDPKDAYGEKKKDLVLEIPKDSFPKDLKLKVGVKIQLKQKKSRAVTQAEIIRVAENTVTLDANHPLAGKKLHFEIELVTIE